MEMTRRVFGKLSLAGVAATSLLVSGCNVFTEIENWAPIGLAAFNSILMVLAIPGGSVLINAIKAALTDIPADIQAYKAAPTASTLQKIDEVLSLLLSNFQAFLAQQSIAGPATALVAGLAAIILSALSGFIADLPQTALLQTKAVLAKKTLIGGSLQVSYHPKKMSILEFKHKWNSLSTGYNHPEAQLHITVAEHLHLK